MPLASAMLANPPVDDETPKTRAYEVLALSKTLPLAVTLTITHDDLRRLVVELPLRLPKHDPSLPLNNVNIETIILTEPVTLHSMDTDSRLLVTFGTNDW